MTESKVDRCNALARSNTFAVNSSLRSSSRRLRQLPDSFLSCCCTPHLLHRLRISRCVPACKVLAAWHKPSPVVSSAKTAMTESKVVSPARCSVATSDVVIPTCSSSQESQGRSRALSQGKHVLPLALAGFALVFRRLARR